VLLSSGPVFSFSSLTDIGEGEFLLTFNGVPIPAESVGQIPLDEWSVTVGGNPVAVTMSSVNPANELIATITPLGSTGAVVASWSNATGSVVGNILPEPAMPFSGIACGTIA
jgi:hypothetical protein